MSKPHPLLMEMPRHVKERITDNVDISTRFKLRKCSKRLRLLIDKTPLHLTSLSLSILGETIQFEFFDNFTSRTMTYSHREQGCLLTISDFGFPRGAPRTIPNDFVILAIHDLSTFLRNPRLVVGKFSVVVKSNDTHANRFLELFIKIFDEFNVQLICETFHIHFHEGQDEVLNFLPFLRPGKLKTIRLEKCEENGEELRSIDKLAELEQWRHAEHLEITHISRMVAVDQLKNFKTISIGVSALEVESFKRIVEHFTTSEEYERCEIICTHLDRQMIRDHFDATISLDPGVKFEKVITQSGSSIIVSVSKFTLEFRRIVKMLL